ncbi:reprolysin-like metallopeptidase [Lewinella sp. W8]|uniref:reprolysin-like metallopeptidase n=1 Tax=Lewinella sp. W8 TaxID=2528208 RepID=UPI0015632FCC|nr:M12 family metallo-peptidase [Lewinella sp. W8]
MKNFLLFALIVVISSKGLLAQEVPLTTYVPTKSQLESSENLLLPERASYHRLENPAQLIESLSPRKDAPATPREFTLPDPDGRARNFILTPYQMVHSSVREMFPELLTARGYDQDRPWVSIVVDWTPHGFHASVRNGAEGHWYINPLLPGSQQFYQSFYTRELTDHAHEPVECITEEILAQPDMPDGFRPKSVGDCQLREYQLALACTGEYANFHGNTDAEVFGEMMTAINRVNQIFGQDLSLQLTLVNQVDMAGNIELVFNNPSTDPYTNNDLAQLLAENQTTCDNVIGSANYDIGHVLATTGGGIATVFSTCQNGFKARGATGLNNPVGDPFYVDLLAHEFGHQFGARHSFNSSNGNCSQRNGPTAYEPGGGSTIMAYSGICGPAANIQFNADDYYHGGSISEIANYLELNFGASCASTRSTSNTAPTVSAGADYTIPTNTPFVLTASGSDVDGDFLTYCWEQADLGPAVDALPTGNETEAPLFRSRPPTPAPERYFPRLSDLANGTVDWEVLPLVSRDMSFVVTLRDLHVAGADVYGCPVQDGMNISVVNTGSQYAVNSPNGGERWQAGSTQTVTWNVAGTTGNGINCANVDIVLSTDGGLTFDQVLVSSVPNNGSRAITVPAITQTDSRIMVRCSDNIFFDISDADFSIEQNDYDFRATINTGIACDGANIVDEYSLELESLQGYTGTVDLSTIGLPGGINPSFSMDPVALGSGDEVTVSLELSGVAAIPPGSYPFIVRASDGGAPKDRNYTLVVKPTLAAATLVSPEDCGFLDPEAAFFDWEAVPNATSYEWRMYSNPAGTGGFNFATTTNSFINFGPNLPVSDGDIRYWGIIAVDENCDPVSQSVSALIKVQFGTAPVLPVEWLSFRASQRGKTALLDWVVRQDAEHLGFTLQRRNDEGSEWADLHWIDALPGEEITEYRFTDREINEASTYYYRLRQEDRDGQTSFSPIRSVSFDGTAATVVFPNPAEDRVFLRTAREYTNYELFDAQGRRQQSGLIQDGRAAIELEALPAGVYQIKVAGAGGSAVVRVVRK